jgi:hypothetical protein
VRDASAYDWLRAFLTIDRLKDLMGDEWNPSSPFAIDRFEAPALHAVHFVVYGILQKGISSSSRIDGLAKSFAEWLRARWVDLPKSLWEQEQALRRKKENEAAAAREEGGGGAVGLSSRAMKL